MALFANNMLNPAALAAWIVVGLFAGWLAGKMMEEVSYGSIGDLGLGAVGGLVGGLAYSLIRDSDGFWGSIAVAAVVACILVGSGRAFVASRGE